MELLLGMVMCRQQPALAGPKFCELPHELESIDDASCSIFGIHWPHARLQTAHCPRCKLRLDSSLPRPESQDWPSPFYASLSEAPCRANWHLCSLEYGVLGTFNVVAMGRQRDQKLALGPTRERAFSPLACAFVIRFPSHMYLSLACFLSLSLSLSSSSPVLFYFLTPYSLLPTAFCTPCEGALFLPSFPPARCVSSGRSGPSGQAAVLVPRLTLKPWARALRKPCVAAIWNLESSFRVTTRRQHRLRQQTVESN